MAESKNTQNLLYTGREYDQIQDYAIAAKLLNRPLWVYTRVDTTVSREFYDILHETGGNVIPYFTVPNYVDPVDDTAKKAGVVSGVILLGFIAMTRRVVRLPAPTPAPVKVAVDPLVRVSRKVTHAEDFVAESTDRLRTKIDEEYEWNDL